MSDCKVCGRGIVQHETGDKEYCGLHCWGEGTRRKLGINQELGPSQQTRDLEESLNLRDENKDLQEEE